MKIISGIVLVSLVAGPVLLRVTSVSAERAPIKLPSPKIDYTLARYHQVYEARYFSEYLSTGSLLRFLWMLRDPSHSLVAHVMPSFGNSQN